MAQGTNASVEGPLVARRSRPGLSGRLDRLSDARFGAVVAAPGLIVVAVFVALPVLIVAILSLFRMELSRDAFQTFVALRNYAVRLGTDEAFLATLPRTIAFAAVATAIAVPVALGAAMLIHGQSRRTSAILGVLLLVPWAVAPIADGILWKLLFEERTGLLNQALSAIGAPQVALSTGPGALFVILAAVVWRSIPLLGVLFLGALRQVPPEPGRAARVDGASAWQTFRHVTLPAIAPGVLVACMLQVVLTLQVFEVQFAVVGDAPPGGSTLAGYQIYRTIIGDISLGYGSAITLVFGAIVAGCVAILYGTVARPSGLVGRSVPEPEQAVPAAEGRPIRDVGAARPRYEPHEAPGPPSLGRRLAVRGRSIGGRLVRGAGIIVLVVWLVGPVIWIVIASTQANANLRASPPVITTQLRFEEYAKLVANPAWQASALVSVTVTTLATVLAVVVATLVAYPLARFGARRAQLILLALLLTLLIPPIALAIPVLFVFVGLGMRNTIAALVFVNAAFWIPILVWLVRGAFLRVPLNIERAARMDGASRLGTIFRIAVPAAAPLIAAAAAIVFIGIWNDFTFTAVLGGRDTSTLPRYLGRTFTPSYSALAATIVLTVAPCILLVALLRRRILGLI